MATPCSGTFPTTPQRFRSGSFVVREVSSSMDAQGILFRIQKRGIPKEVPPQRSSSKKPSGTHRVFLTRWCDNPFFALSLQTPTTVVKVEPRLTDDKQNSGPPRSDYRRDASRVPSYPFFIRCLFLPEQVTGADHPSYRSPHQRCPFAGSRNRMCYSPEYQYLAVASLDAAFSPTG